jgi:hypothetical protein
MKNKHKLAILFFVLAISLVPLTLFFVYDYPHADTYIWQLLKGDAKININVGEDRFDIVSWVVPGFVGFQLSYIMVVVSSAIVFCLCLALIARILINTMKRKPL